jgi:nicotinamide-nucleotide amidase
MTSTLDIAQAVAKHLVAKGWTLALAESCTGGLVCAALTDLAGSSDWFERGYITYSNQAKIECLSVSAETIESFGAVSEEVARAMAEGAQKNAGVNAAVSITGIAGPSGGSTEKPVGTVCFGWTIHKENLGNITISKTMQFTGNREAVRAQARDYALSELIELLK